MAWRHQASIGESLLLPKCRVGKPQMVVIVNESPQIFHALNSSLGIIVIC